MKKLVTAITTVSLLAIAAPALAERTHQASGSAFDDAYRKEHRRQRQNQDNNHQGRDRGDRYQSRGKYDRDKGHDKGKGHGHKYGHSNGNGHKKAHGKGHDRYDRRDRYHDRDRDHRRSYAHYDKKRHYKKHHYKHYKRGHHRWRPAHYHYGYRARHLPTNFIRISFGGLGFFYSDGIFYRPHDHGYVVAQPPIGAVVHSLPGTAVSLVFGGRNYYVAYDTYYLWDGPRRGYRIVANPGFY